MSKTTNFSLVLLAFLATIITTTSAAATNPNFFVTGETLRNDERITQGNYMFVMQGDCNLVLYKGWQSNTANNGKDCKLALDNKGLLTIRSGSGSLVWSSKKTNSRTGEHIAVVHPHGKVVVYGPKVWSSKSSLTTNLNRQSLTNIEEVTNMLFSGQHLYGDGALVGGRFQLVMQGDCNLVLYNGWQSNTASNGKDCFLRLDNYGGLRISDGATYQKVWTNNVSNLPRGEYVAVLNTRGDFSVYGPAVFSTAGDVGGDGDIEMVA